MTKVSPEPIIRHIYYYKDEHDDLKPISGTVEVGIDDFGIINGVVIKEVLRPVYDIHSKRIGVNLRQNKSYVVLKYNIDCDHKYDQNVTSNLLYIKKLMCLKCLEFLNFFNTHVNFSDCFQIHVKVIPI